MSDKESKWREEFERYWFSMPHKDTSKLVKGSKGYNASKSSGIYAYDEALYIVACRARQSEIDVMKEALEDIAQDKWVRPKLVQIAKEALEKQKVTDDTNS